MMELLVLLCFHLLTVNFASSVILSGGPNCSTDGMPVEYARPDDIISITCFVDSSDDRTNLLIWTIPSFGVLVNNLEGANGVDADQTEFTSDVNDFNNALSITNATLSFPAVKGLDGAVLSCQNNNNPRNRSNCTLFILTTPSAPTSLNCTNVNLTSLTLQWSEPTDNGGGEQQLQYNIIGVPGNINETVVNSTYLPLENLSSNTTYNFTITAGNSLGFGPGTSVECTTERNKPLPEFHNITVCLDFNVTEEGDPSTLLNVEGSPCPLSTIAQEFTPEITSLKLFLNGTEEAKEESPEICNFTVTIQPGVYTVDLHANNSAGITISSYNDGSVFNARWLSNIRVVPTTNSAIIHYTTADCVDHDELDVKLISPTLNETKSNDYRAGTSSFSLTDLTQDTTVTFTLNVVASSTGPMLFSTSLTVFSTTSNFIVSPTPTETLSSTGTNIPITTTTTDATSTGERTSSTNPPTTPTPPGGTQGNMLGIIGGATGGGILIIILAGGGGITLAGFIFYKKRSNKTSVDLLGIKGGSGEPIPLRETKEQIPETGQALYQEPDTIQRKQAPTGDLYTQPDKPSRRQPPPPGGSQQMTEMATYQDPNTIERQQAPTGDMYAMPQKKPVYSQVNKENKGGGAMYAELGFEDGTNPPTSPSGQPLIPKDNAHVVYSDVGGLGR